MIFIAAFISVLYSVPTASGVCAAQGNRSTEELAVVGSQQISADQIADPIARDVAQSYLNNMSIRLKYHHFELAVPANKQQNKGLAMDLATTGYREHQEPWRSTVRWELTLHLVKLEAG